MRYGMVSFFERNGVSDIKKKRFRILGHLELLNLQKLLVNNMTRKYFMQLNCKNV
jgi:hypothetical protein